MMAKSQKIIKIFYCYAHEDKALRNELEKHLEPLKRSKQITTWHDRDIQPGTEWKQELASHLDSADIVLLLVSPNFMRSNYCYGVGMQRALERHEAGEARVIPVILRPVDWQQTPLSKLQVLPTDGKPISTWRNRDEAFRDVAKGIRVVVGTLLSQLSTREQRADMYVSWNKRLKDERLKRGWTVQDVCALLGISPNALRRWEDGRGFPHTEFRQRFCQIYEKSSQELGFDQEVVVRERMMRLGRE